MPEKTKKTRRYLTRRNAIILVGAILAIAVSLIAYLVIIGQSSKLTEETEEPTPKMINLSSSEEVSGKIEQTQDDTEKAKLYLDLASSKYREGHMQDGLDAISTSIDIQPTHQAYALAGAIYDLSGDTQQSIDMYKKALELTEKTEDPNQVSFYNDYLRMVRSMGGEI